MDNSIAIVIGRNGAQLHELLDLLNGVESPPVQLLFHSEAVGLVTDGSSIVEELRELESRGVQVLACRTCLSYAGLRGRIVVGEACGIEHMVEAMESAGTVVAL
jgi:intracellular sulfur oxidation DsrE/DsrF family protein